MKNPLHTVRISRPFYLGKHEVTQAQWEAVMERNPSRFKGDATLPVENVSWPDVQEFIRRLNARERGTAVYRLPTEAQWEYAARAGSITSFSFGKSLRQLRRYAWYKANAGGTTHPVGQLQPNAWGLYDMHGNVREWVQDWIGDYASGTAVDPEGPASGDQAGNTGRQLGRRRPRLLVVKSLVHSAELGHRRLQRLSPAQSGPVTLGPRHAAPRLVLRPGAAHG